MGFVNSVIEIKPLHYVQLAIRSFVMIAKRDTRR